MTTPRGYKQTEVGVIPEDWEVAALGDYVCIRNQKTLPAQVEQDRLCVELEHIGQGDGRLLIRGEARNSSAQKYCFQAGDVLFGRLRSYLKKYWLATEKGICTTEIWPLVSNEEEMDGRYLFSLVQTSRFIEAASMAYGTHMPRADWSIIRRLEIPLPPIPEQTAIATVLSDTDNLLSSLQRLIDKKQGVKQAAMQQLLSGQTRLPGFAGEWRVRRLGDICELSMGRTPSTQNPAFWGGNHVWLSIADINGKFVAESKEKITDLAAESIHVIKKGTLLMSFKLSIGRLCFAGCDLYTNEAICSFNELNANAEFLYYQLNCTDFSLYGKQAVKGCTLNKESLQLIEINLPSTAEQTAIAQLLADMDEEITALQKRLDKTCQLKQALMQELLSGSTRLVTPA